MGSLKRMINPGTRPLPDTPNTKSGRIQSVHHCCYFDRQKYKYRTGQPTSRPPSRPTTPNGQNPFDAVPKPHSLTMEKIKNQTSATLDRMALLQERYRQHQEIMKSGGESSRRNSNSSQIDENLVSQLTRWLTQNCIFLLSSLLLT